MAQCFSHRLLGFVAWEIVVFGLRRLVEGLGLEVESSGLRVVLGLVQGCWLGLRVGLWGFPLKAFRL